MLRKTLGMVSVVLVSILVLTSCGEKSEKEKVIAASIEMFCEVIKPQMEDTKKLAEKMKDAKPEEIEKLTKEGTEVKKSRSTKKRR